MMSELRYLHAADQALLPELMGPDLMSGTELRLEGKGLAALNRMSGVVGSYQISTEKSVISPANTVTGKASCYIWDSTIRLPDVAWAVRQGDDMFASNPAHCVLRSNRCDLVASVIAGPVLGQVGGISFLELGPQFSLRLDTNAYAAELGVITLVKGERYFVLADGERHVVLDTRESTGGVLYLEDENDTQPVKSIISSQSQGLTVQHAYAPKIRQTISEEVHGQSVTGFVVNESYRCFVMQKPVGRTSIWVPLLAPVTFGWNIRLEQDSGSWNIVNRDVMMPTLTGGGLELPMWERNSL